MADWKPGDIAYYKQHCAFGPAWKVRVERIWHEDYNGTTVWVMRLSDGNQDLYPMTSGPRQLHASPEAAEEYHRPARDALFGPILKDLEELGVVL